MSNYRAIVHYHFKKGMEEKGIKFLEKELLNKAREYGCHGIELWQDERDPTFLVGIGAWNSKDDARRFQSHWDAKEQELLELCLGAPKREFLKIRSTYAETARKVA